VCEEDFRKTGFVVQAQVLTSRELPDPVFGRVEYLQERFALSFPEPHSDNSSNH
jgi:hypothetical protein